MTWTITKIPEPTVEVGYGQSLEDPRDGLSLFGPLDRVNTGIRWGAIGTARTLQNFATWVDRIQGPVIPVKNPRARPLFPGFEAAFGVSMPNRPLISYTLDEAELIRRISIDDRHQRVFKTVDLFEEAINRARQKEEASVDIWFLILPDDVFKYCRPQSHVPSAQRTMLSDKPTRTDVAKFSSAPSLFPSINAGVRPYLFDPNFRNQLKARLLTSQTIVQIVRESTIAFQSVTKSNGKPLRDLTLSQSDIAWNLATATFYKSGARPWRLANVRPGVCYVGLAFKVDDRGKDPRTACCAAQMFLDSGDGFVFKSHVGPWYNPERGEFHLRKFQATEVIEEAVQAYSEKSGGKPPRELFIHSTTRFNRDEWEGFVEGAGVATKVVGVKIHDQRGFRLFRPGAMPVLRGTAMHLDSRRAYLWTRGFVPRLQTYDGREVPSPLLVEVTGGDAELDEVLADILGLTKLNYNSCKFGDGLPVTLRFADAVGEILTAGPIGAVPPLPFKFYT